jgi:hypothetical protein
MKNSGHSIGPSLQNHRTRIVFGVASVNNHRKVEIACSGELICESSSLVSPRRVVVVIVEAALPYCHRPIRRELLQLRNVAHRIEAGRIMRMNSRREPDEASILARDNPGCTSGAEDIPGAASRADADNSCGS